MKRFRNAVILSAVIYAVIYLAFFIPTYRGLLAQQPGRAPLGRHTSFPPEFAFFLAGVDSFVVLTISAFVAVIVSSLYRFWRSRKSRDKL